MDDLDFDPIELRQKYRRERDKRIRPEGDAQFIEQHFRPLLPLSSRNREDFQDCQYILFHCQLPKNRGFLRKIPHALACPQEHRVISHVLVVKKHLAFIRFYHPNGHIKGCGFTRPVGAQQSHHVAAFEIQVHGFYDVSAPIVFSKISQM